VGKEENSRERLVRPTHPTSKFRLLRMSLLKKIRIKGPREPRPYFINKTRVILNQNKLDRWAGSNGTAATLILHQRPVIFRPVSVLPDRVGPHFLASATFRRSLSLGFEEATFCYRDSRRPVSLEFGLWTILHDRLFSRTLTE
jgi:hypothetical protein